MNQQKSIKLVECPRDAMQGIHHFIDTDLKAEYINLLLQVGFDTIDFGSFVSPKAIPQLKDTAEVLSKLDLSQSKSKLLAIVANLRGVEEAVKHQEISYLGFPFSISETFQMRNTNSTIAASLDTVKQMLELCDQHDKTAVVYLSMGFGNPYGDEWNEEIVENWAGILAENGVKILSLSDTTGVSSPERIKAILPGLIAKFPQIEIGVHLHSTPETRIEKIEAAYESGCLRFDSALKGFGGCPMAADDLTGNLATEDLIWFLESKGEKLNLNMEKWKAAVQLSSKIFL
ncbi:hydroxymethylglutaryl-CoA lyase [Pedobacter sp. KBW06]|uniref:hydroxymethylglutaryl-CoA lyase n=1 Tax=Pedobacter sp. KBW06 TaxID=2153359 RepID=UPI000F5A43EC|nr:hydroxymethylglutaryl-CoA lyase [Pedobacter sp. KBW06]RQO70424.1 hydroxymethylglutaryl-CoA lyase [Pedobacter sp. KBW06]